MSIHIFYTLFLLRKKSIIYLLKTILDILSRKKRIIIISIIISIKTEVKYLSKKCYYLFVFAVKTDKVCLKNIIIFIMKTIKGEQNIL